MKMYRYFFWKSIRRSLVWSWPQHNSQLNRETERRGEYWPGSNSCTAWLEERGGMEAREFLWWKLQSACRTAWSSRSSFSAQLHHFLLLVKRRCTIRNVIYQITTAVPGRFSIICVLFGKRAERRSKIYAVYTHVLSLQVLKKKFLYKKNYVF